ncbi:hypothetical protein Pmani_002780 [Petrolisthes manimaculis]|uniref:Uncharacterized protein n=1 Tax=Petrolisthes manimaculis TaxID=1843537 RepID=A0AAE1UJ44_9EUCA|nr:hypothetical protein Pmani_002768 [Petrolisthes manimaculis]KAK4326763.1 hypothetical protein Pmani_002780 [Petrolisthes manimaculis]
MVGRELVWSTAGLGWAGCNAGFTPVRLAGYLFDRHTYRDVSSDVTAPTTDKSEEIDWTDQAVRHSISRKKQ